MIIIPKGEYPKVLVWGIVSDKEGVLAWVQIICPNAHSFTLDHHVDPNGLVGIPAVCPAKDCDFNEFVKLERWPFGDFNRDRV